MVSGGKEKLLSASASVAVLYPRTRMGCVKGLFPTTSPHSEDDMWAAPKGALCANTEFHRFSDMTFFTLDHFWKQNPSPSLWSFKLEEVQKYLCGVSCKSLAGMVVIRYLRSARELVSRSLGDLRTRRNARVGTHHDSVFSNFLTSLVAFKIVHCSCTGTKRKWQFSERVNLSLFTSHRATLVFHQFFICAGPAPGSPLLSHASLGPEPVPHCLHYYGAG